MVKTRQNTSPEPGGDAGRPCTDREAGSWQSCSRPALGWLSTVRDYLLVLIPASEFGASS